MPVVQIPIAAEPSEKTMQAYLCMPPSDKKVPAIIVAHELFGVTADIRHMAGRLIEEGYVALAPEFYHRTAPAGEALERDDDGRKRGA